MQQHSVANLWTGMFYILSFSLLLYLLGDHNIIDNIVFAQ